MNTENHSYELRREAMRGYLRLVLLAFGMIAVAVIMSALQGCEPSVNTMDEVISLP